MKPSTEFIEQSAEFQRVLRHYNAAIATAPAGKQRALLTRWRDELLADRLAQLASGRISRRLADVFACNAAVRAA